MKLTTVQSTFLVLLRLLCGGHFFYQGMIKLLDSTWSSYSYLVNSDWILSGMFRWMAETKPVLTCVDILNIWGLILIGSALILGVFSRLASPCGVVLLFLYYIAYPPFHSMVSSLVEGEPSFIVNKLLIEMVAFIILFLFPTDSIFGLGRIAPFLFQKKVAPLRSTDDSYAAPVLSRREALSALGTVPVFGIFAYPFLRWGARNKVDALSGATVTVVTDSDRKEYMRLRSMDFNDPAVVATQKNMPVAKIGSLSVSRLICGSNLISMHMHARDLIYVNALATHYNTAERIFMTMKKCEEHGINTIVLQNHDFKQFPLSRYWEEWGGKMQWIADVIPQDINKFEALVVEHLQLGAAAVHLWGGSSGIWYYEKKQDNIVKAYEIMRKYKVPVGIGAHQLEPLVFCEKEGLKPDFYITTLHHDRHWSAHPKENREYMEMFRRESDDHAKYHDNLFCRDHEETIAFMQDVKVPWIAFKVLAAGAIPPEDGFKFAFENGADFICVGMFDFQVKRDAEIAVKAIAESGSRKRAWILSA